MVFRDALKILSEWNAEDTYPWMKRKTVNFISPFIGYILTTIILGIHYIWAVESECSVNFQRGGAMVVLVSAWLFGWIDWHKSEAGILGGGPIKKFDFFAKHFAVPFVAIIGTLTWGYGDLLPWISQAKC